MMTVILALGTARPPQVPHICSVGVFYESVKHTTKPGVELELNSCSNIFGASDESDAFQD